MGQYLVEAWVKCQLKYRTKADKKLFRKRCASRFIFFLLYVISLVLTMQGAYQLRAESLVAGVALLSFSWLGFNSNPGQFTEKKLREKLEQANTTTKELMPEYLDMLGATCNDIAAQLACIKDFYSRRLENWKSFSDKSFSFFICGILATCLGAILEWKQADNGSLSSLLIISALAIAAGAIAPMFWRLWDLRKKASLSRIKLTILSLESYLFSFTAKGGNAPKEEAQSCDHNAMRGC